MPAEYLTPAIEDGAIEVQQMLAAKGQRRAPSNPVPLIPATLIPATLIPATAALAGLAVLHRTRTSN